MEKEYIATIEFEPARFLVHAENYADAYRSAVESAVDLRQIISQAIYECVDIKSVEVEGGDGE